MIQEASTGGAGAALSKLLQVGITSNLLIPMSISIYIYTHDYFGISSSFITSFSLCQQFWGNRELNRRA